MSPRAAQSTFDAHVCRPESAGVTPGATTSSVLRSRGVANSRPRGGSSQVTLRIPTLSASTSSGGSVRRKGTPTGAPETARSDADRTVLTLPTILTLARVAAIPVLLGVWFAKEDSAAIWTGSIFLLACITDFLDGFLARKMGSYSAFGAFLDPVADKLMVCTVLILLSSQPIAAGPLAGNAWLTPVLTSAIIGREIAMSALREWAASVSQEAHKAAAVSQWGKWKTTTQMVALILLLFSSRGADGGLLEASAVLGTPLLCVATFLTVFSLYEYMRALWKYLF